MPKYVMHVALEETVTTTGREMVVEAKDEEAAKKKMRGILDKALRKADYDTDDWKDGGGNSWQHTWHLFNIREINE